MLIPINTPLLNFDDEAEFVEAAVVVVALEAVIVVVELVGVIDEVVSEEDELTEFVIVNHSLQKLPVIHAPSLSWVTKNLNSCPLARLNPGLPSRPLRSTIHVYEEVPTRFSRRP